ncbi:peritrophin-44 [Drosophila subpulchrella]|uniref:peritrophin-44 n=1 Tax=Drosophila subpulchrella TaxID=1486046 RepID=UPI0018A17A9E|nr:peritrophin-44 [Drosophila subpulchrella]
MEKPICFVGVALVLLVLQACELVNARDEDICRLFSNNTVIRDPDSCSRSITCIDFVSHYSSCSGDTPFFDKDVGKCVKSLSSTSSCSISCEGVANHFLADPKSCYGYYYCSEKEIAMYGKCPENTHFNATTETCTYQYESACTTSTFEYCNIVANSVNFDNLQGCDKYHVCEKGKLSDKTCTNQYYQASSGTCVAKALVNCDAHPNANMCGKASKPTEDKFVPDGATCRGYFYCAKQADGSPDQNPIWNQCPQDKFFDESSQMCISPTLVKCTNDRCDGRTVDFVLSTTVGCRNYYYCSGGVASAEKSCGNYFFDEELGGCVPNIKSYTACTK